MWLGICKSQDFFKINRMPKSWYLWAYHGLSVFFKILGNMFCWYGSIMILWMYVWDEYGSSKSDGFTWDSPKPQGSSSDGSHVRHWVAGWVTAKFNHNFGQGWAASPVKTYDSDLIFSWWNHGSPKMVPIAHRSNAGSPHVIPCRLLKLLNRTAPHNAGHGKRALGGGETLLSRSGSDPGAQYITATAGSDRYWFFPLANGQRPGKMGVLRSKYQHPVGQTHDASTTQINTLHLQAIRLPSLHHFRNLWVPGILSGCCSQLSCQKFNF